MEEKDLKKFFNLEDFARDFIIVNKGTTPHRLIKATDGKEVPDELKGMYTSEIKASQAITQFLFKKYQEALKAAKVKKRKNQKKRRETYEKKQELNGRT